MGGRFLLLQSLKRSPLSRFLHSISPIPTPPPPRTLRFGLLLPSYRSSDSIGPYRHSWASRSLSYGSVNLVLSDGKPRFETHEIEQPRKERYRTKKRLKLQRKREKRKRREANKKDPRRIGPKGKKMKGKFPTAEARITYKIEKIMTGSFHSLQRLGRLLVSIPHLSSHVSSPLNCISPYCKGSNLLEPCKHSLVIRHFMHCFTSLAILHGQPKLETCLRSASSSGVLYKVHNGRPFHGLLMSMEQCCLTGCCGIHTSQPVSNMGQDMLGPQYNAGNELSVGDNCIAKPKRKKLKGKRAVVRWLKFFRWKKKKDYERMTAEEKILYKLGKARRKEERFVQALKKLEPSEVSETTHDPEVLTPEEHFYFLKMGLKCKNYVPVGRRGIFQGVILNMHLHWKKHQTLKVVVKTFTPEEVREIAAELARLSGGIVLDIHEENTIIMYRGKNYAQPPTEIMSPRITLSKRKALDKSKHRDRLQAVRRYIPKLQQDLEDLRVQMQRDGENKGKPSTVVESPDAESNRTISDHHLERFEELGVKEAGSNELEEDESLMESSAWSESEDLSDMFETDSEGGETEEKWEKPLYLDEVERFPSVNGGKPDDFEEHLRQIAAASKSSSNSLENDAKLADLDEVDKIFLRASSLLKPKRR